MSHTHRRRWRFAVGLGAGLFLGGLALAADEAPPPPPAAAAEVRVLTLDEALRLAYAHQPNLAAARASLAAAEAQQRALCDLHAVPLVPGSRELPVRRDQAALGVCIARAALIQAEYDAAYAVRRTYIAAQYAQAQYEVTKALVERLGKYNAPVEGVIKDPEARGKAVVDAGQVVIYYRLARSRNEEAKFGVARARAALREAVGLPPDACFDVPDEGWFRVTPDGKPPFPEIAACKADVVALALARRGEPEQAAALTDVHRLEVEAQCKNCLPTARTFAAGSDIHARQVPPAFDDGAGTYRPGALAPEMPTLLVGPKCDRKERAEAFASRAESVADKARNLVALEAEEVYWRWAENRARALETYEAARAALVLQRPALEEALGDVKADAVRALAFAAQGRAGYNEVLYHYLVSLASLERVTAGGISSGLGAAPGACAQAQPLPAPQP